MRSASSFTDGNLPRKMTQPFDPASIVYYNENSDAFIANTADVDMGKLYEPFLEHVPTGGRILDLGCGSGRDSKFFSNQFYDVVAIDASAKMVEATRSIVDADVLQLRFDEMDFADEFDGIWACASLLHIPEAELKNILEKCLQALRPPGSMFVSFKYGSTQRTKGGRLFTDLNEGKLMALLDTLKYGLVVSHWVTPDARPDRPDEKWLNAVIRIKGAQEA
jgi:SAM-dependent methyltransferase